jgi:hypothetical protein
MRGVAWSGSLVRLAPGEASGPESATWARTAAVAPSSISPPPRRPPAAPASRVRQPTTASRPPPPGLRLPPAEAIPQDSEELDRSGRFGPAAFRRYERELAYTTAAYLDVLRTYSGHRALDAERRRLLLECLAGLIDARYGGRVAKRYLTELRVAHRTA